jgi:hypothetical protein
MGETVSRVSEMVRQHEAASAFMQNTKRYFKTLLDDSLAICTSALSECVPSNWLDIVKRMDADEITKVILENPQHSKVVDRTKSAFSLAARVSNFLNDAQGWSSQLVAVATDANNYVAAASILNILFKKSATHGGQPMLDFIAQRRLLLSQKKLKLPAELEHELARLEDKCRAEVAASRGSRQ